MTQTTISGGVVHEMPADLKKKLTSSADVQAIWESLSPLARNEWICWVITVKKKETRDDHIERAFTELISGMRRPCCWAGCLHRTDRPLSSTKQWLLKKQAKAK